MKRLAPLALLLAAACTGTVGPGGSGGSSSNPPSSTPGGPGAGPGQSPGGGGSSPSAPSGPPPSTGACDAQSVPRARTWRLTNSQYRNTVRAAFGYTGMAADALPEDGQPDGFSSQSDRLSVPPLLAAKYLAVSEDIAANVLSRAGEFIKCPVASLGSGTCLKDFLAATGARAWRRPLTSTELDKYGKLFADLAASNTPEVGFKGVVQALLLSPHFVFRTELGHDGKAATTSLTDHELASALSYMLADGPPDAALMQLADNGKLHEPANLRAEAKRLLAGGAGPVSAFFRQWMQFDGLPALAKDTALFPIYTPELVTDLMAENQALLDAVLFDAAGDHSVKTLLTANYAYLNSRTAPLYGVTASGTALTKTNLPATQRRGLFTQAAFISGVSDSDDTNLPARGRIVREQMLCATVAPPSGNFQIDDAKITPDMTNREKFNAHATNPACTGCHILFDGIGFAMEQYDAVGRFRTMDKTKVIDANGTLPLEGKTLSFSSYVDLIDQVVKLPETYDCFAAQYTAYATGRAASTIPSCEGKAIAQAFADGGYRLDGLVAAIVSSPSFTVRRN